MDHAVTGGGACYSYKGYDSDNTDCSGEPLYEGSWIVGVSVEDGCVDWYDGSSTSYYCDNTGYHNVVFSSSSDCTGNAVQTYFGPNGCNEYSWGHDFESCSLAGPCEDDTAKSVV